MSSQHLQKRTPLSLPSSGILGRFLKNNLKGEIGDTFLYTTLEPVGLDGDINKQMIEYKA